MLVNDFLFGEMIIGERFVNEMFPFYKLFVLKGVVFGTPKIPVFKCLKKGRF
jgi:hypothetical protein